MKPLTRILLAALLLCCPSLHAADAMKSWTTDDGLSGMVVTKIFKDSDKFVWLGVSNHLDCLDGVYIRHYPLWHGERLNMSYVNDIVQRADGVLFVGTGEGLWRLDRSCDEMKSIGMFDGICINALACAGDTLYVGTTNGLIRVDGDRFEEHVSLMPDARVGSAANVINDVFCGTDGRVWLATACGLACYSSGGGTVAMVGIGMDEPLELQAVVELNGILYLGSHNRGLVCHDPAAGICRPYVDVHCNDVHELSTDGVDRLFVATNGGGGHVVSASKGCIEESFSKQGGAGYQLPENAVYSFLCDDDGNYWFGLYYGGVLLKQVRRPLFKTYSCGDFSSYDLPVRSFCFVGNEKLIGTRNGLYVCDEGTGRTTYYGSDAFGSGIITTICKKGDDWYIGTYGGGLHTLNTTTHTIGHDVLDEVPDDAFIPCITIRNGFLWICADQSLIRYNPSTRAAEKYSSINSQLPQSQVFSIFFDQNGMGWICTQTGLRLFDEQRGVLGKEVFPKGFPCDAGFRQATRDAEGNICLVSPGIIVRTDPKLTRWEEIRLPEMSANYRFWLSDDYGNNWVCDENGLFVYDRDLKLLRQFTSTDNLPDLAFTGEQPYLDEKGTLWLGNRRGLLYVTPREAKDYSDSERPAANLTVSFAYINDEPLHDARLACLREQHQIRLQHDEKKLQLYPVLLDYSGMNHTYEYQLEGYDKKWLSADDKVPLTYYDLPRGTHTLHVRVKDYPLQITDIAIMVSRRYSAQIFTLLALVVLAGCCVYFGVKYGALKRAKRQHDEEERERAEQQRMKEENGEDERYKQSRADDKELAQIRRSLNTYVEKNKPFLNPGLKMTELADKIGCPAHKLSQVFSLDMGINYYDYINNCRLNEFKTRVKKAEYNMYGITALAEMCGFSRTTFFTTFKRVDGLSPSEWLAREGIDRR